MEGGGGEQEAEGEEEKEVAVPSLLGVFPVAHAPPEVVSMISSLLEWKGGRPAGGAPSGARRKGGDRREGVASDARNGSTRGELRLTCCCE